MSAALHSGINQARADVIHDHACQLHTALDALAALGGRKTDDTVSAAQVRWFSARLREHVAQIMRAPDLAEPKPPEVAACAEQAATA